jgi:stearoyl-CoA desaturase (Delta-9 desaturase)
VATAVAWSTPRRIEWLAAIPFILIHLGAFAWLFTGFTWQAAAWCAALYVARMFAITAGYHRYFSHRTYKTSRWFQFVLAYASMTSSQRGVLWWAAHHRTHHKLSDLPGDMHSPVQDGFWYSHFGWIYNHTGDTNLDKVRDLAKFPELVWLNRFWIVPPLSLAALSLALFGWSGLFLGFMLSTVLVWHVTFLVNSLAHVVGSRRYATTDDSRNSLWIALLTFGEGWHNNHHHYMHSTRQGFFWWEIDITYYGLKALSWLGLVWDLRDVPEEVRTATLALRSEEEQKGALPGVRSPALAKGH